MTSSSPAHARAADPPSWFRIMIPLTAAWLAAIFACAAAAGLTRSWIAASCCATLAAAGVACALWLRPPRGLDLSSCSRAFTLTCSVAAVVALLLVSRLAVFMIDPSRTMFSVIPGSTWELRHSCLTAYYVAAQNARRVPDIYEPSLYASPDDRPGQPRKPLRLGRFNVDQYEYPPTFLLLPRAVSLVTAEFEPLRSLWFAINGAVVVAVLVLVAWRLRPEAASRALLLAPFVFGSPFVTLDTLQKGNVQLMVIALSMLSMLLIERRRTAAGGALLAFMTVAKLYPGMLVVYLLVRRDWKALAWTLAFAGLFVGVTVLDLGVQPFMAFREQLPGLLNGEAFPAFRNPSAVAINHSIPGLVFKLKLFGVPGMGFEAARLVGTLYTVVALAVTVMLGRRTLRSGEEPIVWLTILIIATLRSPVPAAVVRAVPGDLAVDAARSGGTSAAMGRTAPAPRVRAAEPLRSDRFRLGSAVGGCGHPDPAGDDRRLGGDRIPAVEEPGLYAAAGPARRTCSDRVASRARRRSARCTSHGPTRAPRAPSAGMRSDQNFTDFRYSTLLGMFPSGSRLSSSTK